MSTSPTVQKGWRAKIAAKKARAMVETAPFAANRQLRALSGSKGMAERAAAVGIDVAGVEPPSSDSESEDKAGGAGGGGAWEADASPPKKPSPTVASSGVRRPLARHASSDASLEDEESAESEDDAAGARLRK